MSQRNRIPIASAFFLNRERIEEWSDLGNERLPAATLHLPSEIDPKFQPMLFTQIRIHGHHTLEDYDSGLTYPKALMNCIKPDDTLQFHYELGDHPRLCCVINSATETTLGAL